MARYWKQNLVSRSAHNEGEKVIAVLTAFNKNNPTWSMFIVQVKRNNPLPKFVREIEL